MEAREHQPASGWKLWKTSDRNSKSQISPMCRSMCFPLTSPHLQQSHRLPAQCLVVKRLQGRHACARLPPATPASLSPQVCCCMLAALVKAQTPVVC